MLCSRKFFVAVVAALVMSCGEAVHAVELTTAEVLDVKGDGPDGKGNTADDTWQFWLSLAHNPNQYVPLDICTQTMTPDQREHGIRVEKAKHGKQKVEGPIASKLPHPNDTEGWIYHSDWNGKMEGVWADKKTNTVMAHPYVEKRSHCAVAITYKVPEDGKYNISGGVTDLMVEPFKGDLPRIGHIEHDGIEYRVEQVENGNMLKQIGKGGPVGDGDGRPDSEKFEYKSIELKKGQLVRLVIHPRAWWGSDLTGIDHFKIEKE
ncbi:MAG: hypothetical protein K8T25_17840 [Planctomycetia bacterium]|nr:hypothetical protein [Planctomycetia bacterium]